MKRKQIKKKEKKGKIARKGRELLFLIFFGAVCIPFVSPNPKNIIKL